MVRDYTRKGSADSGMSSPRFSIETPKKRFTEMNADAKPKAHRQSPRGPDERLDALIQITSDIAATCVRFDQTAIAMNEQIMALVEMQARTDEYIRLFNLRNVGKTR